MNDLKKVLITGGNGMVGSRLTTLLVERGYRVAHLRRSRQHAGTETFLWNPATAYIDKNAFRDVSVIVHLAGAGIADQRWTAKRKQEIWKSRTEGAALMYDTLIKEPHAVRTFISASGISYYGLTDTGKALKESDPPGDDFMARVAQAWERAADAFSSQDIRVVKMRTGVVLSQQSIALRRIAGPIRFFVGAPLGTGKQIFNWIHIDDLCGMFIKAIEDESMRGSYNAVAPAPVTNKTLTREVAKILKRPLWLPPVPGFLVRIIAGEVADVVLSGGSVSSEKIRDAGFQFQFLSLQSALRNIYSR